ncbi:hypothetical protein FE257_005222 [Aspergillus nanangensis]|uniref:Uncharacterized protein n=1 Tax=Aspergillus nanangensis TaxID=2582783 RepID=A0AAD4GVS9_ASPNN|nr:hypothetical protein FE257_005222 [Aspergillus nanangensis]
MPVLAILNPQAARSVPRQDSRQAIHHLNQTTFRADQSDWSWENMPEILYQFKPEEKRDRKATASTMSYEIHGELLRDLPVLPDNISSAVEEFRVEAWMRLDRRIRLRDITSRMHPSFRVNVNALQQRSVRFRQMFSMIAWDSGNKRSLQLEESLLTKMAEKNIDPTRNSTRGITPGLIDPALGEAGGRIPLPGNLSQPKTSIKWASKHTPHLPKPDAPHPCALQLPTQAEKLVAQHPMTPMTVVNQQTAFPEEPIQVPDTPERTSEQLQFIQKFVPWDIKQRFPQSPPPIIECPEVVTMEDIDLSRGMTWPFQQHGNLDRVLKSAPSYRVTKRTPRPLVFRRNLCAAACQKWTVRTPQSAIPRPELDLKQALLYETLSPSRETSFVGRIPYPDTIFPERVRAQVFRSMVGQCFSGERYLFQLPYLADVMEVDDKMGF